MTASDFAGTAAARIPEPRGMADIRALLSSLPAANADAEPAAAKDWRTRAKERLAGRFIMLDPLRRNFRDNEIDSANEIVEFDLQDVRDADLLLVNYCKPSLGTAMEVFYAGHDLGKFVIAFSPYTFADCSPWMVRFCTKILPDLESALVYIERHFA